MQGAVRYLRVTDLLVLLPLLVDVPPALWAHRDSLQPVPKLNMPSLPLPSDICLRTGAKNSKPILNIAYGSQSAHLADEEDGNVTIWDNKIYIGVFFIKNLCKPNPTRRKALVLTLPSRDIILCLADKRWSGDRFAEILPAGEVAELKFYLGTHTVLMLCTVTVTQLCK